MERARLLTVALVVLALLLTGALAADQARDWLTPEEATVTVLDEDENELGTVRVETATTIDERRTGLSEHESLGPDEGMLFVHEVEGNYAYVMREMAFPIDIVFVDANRTITAVHHAEPEEPPLTRYEGRAKWVLEVNYEWTTERGVEVGDRVRIDWPDEPSPTASG